MCVKRKVGFDFLYCGVGVVGAVGQQREKNGARLRFLGAGARDILGKRRQLASYALKARKIVKKAGKPIPDIFAEVGEAGFREIEAAVIREVANESRGAVIATGGGAILRDDNLRALRRAGRLYFLDRPLADLLPTADRPLASSAEAIKQRYAERYSRYCASADVTISAPASPEEAAAMIRKDFFR